MGYRTKGRKKSEVDAKISIKEERIDPYPFKADKKLSDARKTPICKGNNQATKQPIVTYHQFKFYPQGYQNGQGFDL